MALSEKKKFLNWIKTHPSCEHIRKQAGNTEVIYDVEHSDPNQRIKIFDIPISQKKKSIFTKIKDNIWVPGYKLRGNSYSDTNFDQQLNQTSSIMSISGVFDMICTAPVLYYFTQAAGLLALPLSLGYGYMLLIMSNKAGEFSMNRPKGNNTTANFLLLIFFLLSMVKTLMSGVGIDLVSRSGEIKNSTAEELLIKQIPTNEDSNVLYTNLLEKSKNECDRLIQEQSKLDPTKRAQRKLYNQLQENMYKSIKSPESDPRYLLDNNLSEIGPCTRVDLIEKFNGKNKFKRINIASAQNNLRESLSPISFLYVFQRNQFNNIFTGNPLKGSESNFEPYKKVFNDSATEFNIGCLNTKENCEENVAWSNPAMAINEAAKQFYGRILNKEWENLGLSYVGFLISILLSATATILLYTSSIDIKNRASRSSLVEDWRDDYFLELDEEEEKTN